jgi:protein lifeguard
VQLLVTIGFCCLSYFVPAFFQFQMTYWWVTIIAIVFMYVIMGVILCTESHRKFPHNIIWLTMFTLCFSYLISQITSVYAYYYGGPLVLIAAGLTLFMVLGLTLYAIFSRNDFRILFGIIIVLLFSFLGFGILCIFTLSPILYQLYCAIAVSILGILLVIDTKLIIGGQKSIQISMDDYILGSLILYIDIMRLFIIILQILGAGRR